METIGNRLALFRSKTLNPMFFLLVLGFGGVVVQTVIYVHSVIHEEVFFGEEQEQRLAILLYAVAILGIAWRLTHLFFSKLPNSREVGHLENRLLKTEALFRDLVTQEQFDLLLRRRALAYARASDYRNRLQDKTGGKNPTNEAEKEKLWKAEDAVEEAGDAFWSPYARAASIGFKVKKKFPDYLPKEDGEEEAAA